MKKMLKNAAIFLAGGMVSNFLMAREFESNTRYPKEGAIEYEDENIKVIRMNAKKEKINIATIVHKNQTTDDGKS